MVTRIQITRQPPPPPTGNWIKRAWQTVAVEGRLPYRIQIPWDSICNRAGYRVKTVCARGLRLRVRRLTCDEQFVQTVISDRDYNPPGFEIGETDTVIDIGGNIGTFALYAGKCASRGRVFTYEPESQNFGLLSANLRLNRAANVHPIRAAVGGTSGTMRLFRASQGGFHTIVEAQARNPGCEESVSVVTLQQAFDDNGIERCHFLKLDCEGAEYDILNALPASYFARIDKIALEYHGPSLAAAREQSAALASRLEGLGFAVSYEEYDGLACGFIRARRV